MDGFQRRKNLKMNNILKAARDMFCARGIREVSIAEISKAAEVSQVSIYNFFGSKENLAKEVIFSIMNEKMTEAEVLVDSNIPFSDKMEKLFIDEKETIYGYNEEFLNSPIWKEPAVRTFVQEYYHTRTIPLLIKLIERGKEEGFINPSINSEAAIIYINSINNSLNQDNINKKTRVDIGELFCYGLLGKSQK